MLERVQQFLAKIQTVPGTPETLAAADGKVRVDVGVQFEAKAPPIKREIATSNFSPIGLLVGEKGGGIALVTEINTPDIMTGLPEHEALLRSCGLTVTPTRRIPIGAISTGPMLRNATITGGTSSATGRLLVEATNGDTHLYYAPISGSFTSGEVITASGGGTATSSAVSAVFGARANPVTPSEIITCEFQNDGFGYSLRDCMSNVSFDVEASMQGKFKFSPMGVKSAWGTKALTSGIAFDTGEPPLLQASSLKIGSFAPVFSKVGFDLGAKQVYRKDANAVGNTGLRGAYIVDRDPRLKMTVEHELTATFDFFGGYDAQTKYPVKFQIGTVPGKRFFHYSPAAQLASAPTLSSLDGIRGLELEFLLTSSAQVQGADGEFEWLWL